MKKNDLIPLSVTDVTLSGYGVGHADGMAILVPASAAGDEIVAQILKVKKTFAYGKVREIREPSGDRIDPRCPVFPKCGGCLFEHLSYAAELRLKENQVRENLRRIGQYSGDVGSIVPSPKVEGYRNKAQYPLSMRDGTLSIGFYAQRSHRVIRCLDCLLQPDVFGTILRVFEDWIRTYAIPIYDETTHTGLLRHIYIRRGEKTGEILVCAVATKKTLPHADALCAQLKTRVPQIRSIVLNVNAQDTNVILGKTCIPLSGDGTIEDELCGLRFRLSAMSFYQVNALQVQALYEKAAQFAEPDGAKVLDLYCGAGTIGLTMAQCAKEVVGVEIVPEAIRDANENARRNGIENARFLCADASQAVGQLLSEGFRPDVIVVDPPRKGCAPEVLDAVFRFAPERLVYISCDSATLARDIAVLQQGGYAVETAVPFDMFPRTGHVETVVLLSRKNIDDHLELTWTDKDFGTSGCKATYSEIQEYILDKYGFKVSSLNIAQIKSKCGIIERENYNLPKSENSRQAGCTPEKEEAIMDAFRHFNLIQEDSLI